MLPFLNAFQAFLTIFSLLPVPVRAFITTFAVISFGLGVLHLLTNRT